LKDACISVPTFGVDPTPAISFDQGNDLTDLHFGAATRQNRPVQLMGRGGVRGINEFVRRLSEFQANCGFIVPKFARYPQFLRGASPHRSAEEVTETHDPSIPSGSRFARQFGAIYPTCRGDLLKTYISDGRKYNSSCKLMVHLRL
jgi:hypothetical protein